LIAPFFIENGVFNSLAHAARMVFVFELLKSLLRKFQSNVSNFRPDFWFLTWSKLLE